MIFNEQKAKSFLSDLLRKEIGEYIIPLTEIIGGGEDEDNIFLEVKIKKFGLEKIIKFPKKETQDNHRKIFLLEATIWRLKRALEDLKVGGEK